MDAEGAKTNLTDLIEDIMDFLLTNRAHPDSIRDIAEMALGTQMSRTPEEIKGILIREQRVPTTFICHSTNRFHFAIPLFLCLPRLKTEGEGCRAQNV